MDKEEENENDLNEILKLASQNSLSSFLSDKGLSVFEAVFQVLREQLKVDVSLNSLRAKSHDQLCQLM